MKKITTIAGALLLSLMSAPAQAFDNDACNYHLDYDLSVHDSNITFNNDAITKITIDQDNNLFVNDSEKQLSIEQQRLITNYADSIRVLIPEVTAIAIEGVNIGVKAASMALGIILDEGDPDYGRFSDRINELANTITSKLDANHFDTKHIEESFDEGFEEEIESIVSEAVEELTPRLMAKIVTAAMSGEEGEISDLEARAERLESEIENFVEPRAAALEARAEELCDSIDSLNSIETELVSSGLEMMNLIEEGDDNRSKHNSLNFNLGD